MHTTKPAGAPLPTPPSGTVALPRSDAVRDAAARVREVTA
jgi:hypothetical protein